MAAQEISQLVEGFTLIGFVAGAFLFMLGFRRAGHFLFLMVLFTFVTPFILELLPHWVIFIAMGVLALVFLQIIAGFIFGQRAADAMVGSLAADMVRILFRLLILPLWIVRVILRSLRP